MLYRLGRCAIKGIPPGPEGGGPPVVTDDRTKAEIVPYLGLQAFDETDELAGEPLKIGVERLMALAAQRLTHDVG